MSLVSYYSQKLAYVVMGNVEDLPVQNMTHLEETYIAIMNNWDLLKKQLFETWYLISIR